jgi:predicted nuclease with TOPRIM domain
MNQKFNNLNKEFFYEQKNLIRVSFDELLSKVKLLISRLKEARNENSILKENIKNLNLKISELKLQLTKINTEQINKDKEISELKNLVLNSTGNKIPLKDKDEVKSRIKELISRIDTHLEQHDNGEKYQ